MECIEPKLDNTVTVRWKDGQVSSGNISILLQRHKPEMVLQMYKRYTESRIAKETKENGSTKNTELQSR